MELVKNLKQTSVYKYFLVILISSTLLAISANLMDGSNPKVFLPSLLKYIKFVP